MKKQILFLLLFTINWCTTKAQIAWSNYSQTYPDVILDDPAAPVLITAVPKFNNSFWVVNGSAGIRRTLASDSGFIRNRPSDFTVVTTFDDSKAEFFLRGVNRKNAGLYRFRVLNSEQKEVLPWSDISSFAADSVQKASGYDQLAHLGGFKAPLGEYLIVDVKRNNSEQLVATAVVKWEPIRPVLMNIYTTGELNEFLHKLSHPEGYRMSAAEIERWKALYKPGELDEATALPKMLRVDPNQNGLIFFLRAEIYNRNQLQYELIKNKQEVISWKANDFDNGFIWLKDLSPGRYTLRIRYSVQPQNVTEYPFEVGAAWQKSTAFKIVLGSLIAAFFGFIVILFLYLRQKQRGREDAMQRMTIQHKLKALQSQLNPHFVSNSLNSIQGLINKGNIPGANNYLSVFAKLLRETLALSDARLSPLVKEIAYLEDYLQLEQLRFNFDYKIEVDKNLNIHDTDFPTLLLQPLVENAVKHGISNSTSKGMIKIGFHKSGDDLKVNIEDNGSGFDSSKSNGGYGLNLTRERINLLNELWKEKRIVLDIGDCDNKGASIQITFKSWFYGN